MYPSAIVPGEPVFLVLPKYCQTGVNKKLCSRTQINLIKGLPEHRMKITAKPKDYPFLDWDKSIFEGLGWDKSENSLPCLDRLDCC